MRRITLTIGLTAMLAWTVWAQESDAATQDQALLQGEWTMVSGQREGTVFDEAMINGSKRVAKDDETTVTIQGQLFMKAKFKLDPSKKPKAIDYSITGGNYEGATQLGIYEIEGDTVKFCFARPGKPRPTDFSTKTDDGRTSTVWKREKK